VNNRSPAVEGALPASRLRLAFLLVALLSTLAVALSACDGSGPDGGPGGDRPCSTFEGCRTLNGISQVRDEPFVVSDALVSTSGGTPRLHVAMTAMTRRFDSVRFNPDEIFVLSRPLDPALADTDPSTDSLWSIQQLTDAPDSRFGGAEGAPMLSVAPGGEPLMVWAELASLGAADRLAPDTIWESLYRDQAWSEPQLAYDLPPVPPTSLSGGRLPAALALDPAGSLHAAFRGAGTSGFGRVEIMERRAGAWSEPVAPFGEETEGPWIAGLPDGTLVAAYIDLDADRDSVSGLLVRRRPAGRAVWSAPIRVIGLGNTSEDPDIRVYRPRLLRSGPETLHLLFPYDTPRASLLSDQIWHSVSTDGGRSWSEPGPVNASDRDYANQIAAAIDGRGHLHVIYLEGPFFSDRRSESRVRHTVYSQASWQVQPDLSDRPIALEGSVGLSLAPGPAGCLHAVWDEIIDTKTNATRLRYRRLGCP